MSRPGHVQDRTGYGPGMENNPQNAVNDQSGESGPGVIDQTEHGEQTEHAAQTGIPVSPTPEPPETAPEAEASDGGH
jgi:hypothetical protein